MYLKQDMKSSKDINHPIIGLKKLSLFKKSNCKEIRFTSIKDSHIDITIYTDIDFDVFYWIVE